MKNVLSAFNGDIVEKNNQISSLNIWLQEKEAPKSIQEQVNSLFNPVRIFLLPEIAVEDFYSYPEKLGLPSWLGQLNRTIDHHNSSDYNYGKENYQTDFY